MNYSREKIQLVKELHAPARRKFERRSVVVKGLDECWQADLIDLQKYSKFNRGYKYILTVIDNLSKFAWSEGVKNKTGKEVARAFKDIFKLGRVPKNLQVDNGCEFYNSDVLTLFEKHEIHMYSTYSVLKASIVGRFNRTLKDKMFKIFSLNGNYNWIDNLKKIMKEYNSSKHRTIGMKPIDVDEKREKILLSTVFSDKTRSIRKEKFKIGDNVRISKYKHFFEKSYTPNWTTEVFKVLDVKRTIPTTYLLVDSNEKPILGGFYEYELQKVANPDVFLIEKVIKRQKGKVFVKWLGLSKENNSWIDNKNVL